VIGVRCGQRLAPRPRATGKKLSAARSQLPAPAHNAKTEVSTGAARRAVLARPPAGRTGAARPPRSAVGPPAAAAGRSTSVTACRTAYFGAVSGSCDRGDAPAAAARLASAAPSAPFRRVARAAARSRRRVRRSAGRAWPSPEARRARTRRPGAPSRLPRAPLRADGGWRCGEQPELAHGVRARRGGAVVVAGGLTPSP